MPLLLIVLSIVGGAFEKVQAGVEKPSTSASPVDAGHGSAAGAGNLSFNFTLRGLKRPADILVDRWGVAHIFANDDGDAFFLQGFNVARDRLFQIDLWRRRGLGQLAEVLGPAYVKQDRAARLFLYRGDMEAEWRRYGTGAHSVAKNFTAGINAYIDWLADHPDRLPYEFRLAGYWPAKWSAEDVVRIRTSALVHNLKSEVARAKVACHASLEVDQVRAELQPAWRTRVPAGLDPCLPDDVLKVFDLATQGVKVARDTLSQGDPRAVRIPSAERQGEETEGSNNWVVAPWKTTTGRAIMANDPHRAYAAPSLRYIVQLSSPSFDLIGAGEPSAPGVAIGHNGTIAFGLTIFDVDQEDLYVYDTDPRNATRYRYRGGWKSFRTIHDTIAVRGSKPVQVDLMFSMHGPVISFEPSKHRAFAVRTAWLQPGMSPYLDSLRYMRAKNFAQFRQALSTWGAPAVNQVYADTRGNIGWVASGLVPRRPNWDGLMPVPGDGRYEWGGFWRGDQLPWTFNPAAGYFTSSNQMNLPAGYPSAERRLGFEWTNGSRHERIDEVLKALPKVSLDDAQCLQNDVESIPARRLVALLSPLSSDEKSTQAALSLLKGWNGEVRADSAPAALEEVWFSRYLGSAYKAAVLPKAAAATFGAPDPAAMLDALEVPQGRFGEDAWRKRDALLLTTLRDAYNAMVSLQGSDPSEWQWGRLQTNLSPHPFADLADEPMRSRLNVGPLPKGGDPFTPNQSTYRASDFRQMNGPSFRIVVDVGNWDDARAVNLPGQSGDPDSPHYRDLAPLWLAGKYFPLRYTRTAVEAETEERLHLTPDRH